MSESKRRSPTAFSAVLGVAAITGFLLTASGVCAQQSGVEGSGSTSSAPGSPPLSGSGTDSYQGGASQPPSSQPPSSTTSNGSDSKTGSKARRGGVSSRKKPVSQKSVAAVRSIPSTPKASSSGGAKRH